MGRTSISPARYPSLLRAVAAYGLAGTQLDLPDRPLPEHDFMTLHGQVRAHKLTGLLWTAVADGVLPVTATQRRRVEESHLERLAGVVLLEELLVSTLGSLSESAVPVRVLKGAALAHLDYPTPEQRTFGDIDLLVPTDQFDASVNTLLAAGCTRRFPEPRKGFTQRFGKGSCLVAQNGLEVDLHRTLATGPYGLRLDLDRVWAEPETFALAGASVAALSVEGRILHAAYQAVLGDRRPKLNALRDLAQLLLAKPVNWQRLRELMVASNGEAVVARAVRTAWRELDLADILTVSAWAAQRREDQRATAHLALYEERSTYAAQALATARAIPSVAGRARFLVAMTLPDRSYLEGRHAGHRARLRRGIADIRHTRSAM